MPTAMTSAGDGLHQLLSGVPANAGRKEDTKSASVPGDQNHLHNSRPRFGYVPGNPS